MTRRILKPNPKMVGSNLIDCKPQKGFCSLNCNQCFYNRPNACYIDPAKSIIPTKKMSEGKIVRMNSLHDSNIDKRLVIKIAERYKHVFFNTSIPNFDFPEPVVYTANSFEERPVEVDFLRDKHVRNIMFIRLRVSTTNLDLIENAVKVISEYSNIPIVLTFMAYYDECPPDLLAPINGNHPFSGKLMKCYVWKVRHINEYWCPTSAFKRYALNRMNNACNRPMTICGTFKSNYCRDCRCCEVYYWMAYKRLSEEC